MNILEKANDIVFNRSEEKERMYGPMSETNLRASKICSVLSNKKITTLDIYNMLISLKLARESHNHKEDNLLDLVAYLAGLNNYWEGTNVCGNDIIANNNEERIN
jgi:hypothetical protein